MILLVTLAGVPFALVFLIVALVLFALAALNVPSSRVSLGWAGAFFLALGAALA